jgi:hypothetical protein
MEYVFDDSGSGSSDLRDCVTRSIAIATELPYDEVYERVVECVRNFAAFDDDGSYAVTYGALDGPSYEGVPSEAVEGYLTELGFVWHRCGLGNDALPASGRLIVVLPEHFTAVIDNVVHDTWDCRGRPVEGYWVQEW